jgi:hypothetical protein
MHVDWASLLSAVTSIERLELADTGLLSFGVAPIGAVLVERGRVCWVAAHGLQRRLRDLLRSSARADEAVLDRTYERCRAEGLLLGETLVAQGILQSAELESALRRHSAECLAHLCQTPQPLSWASHLGRGYAPQFTFRALELLLDTVGLYYPELQVDAHRRLAPYGAPGRKGVAFVLDADLDAPLPLAEVGCDSVRGMTDLGIALCGMPLASRELGFTPSFTLCTRPGGDGVLAWWDEHTLFAVACQDRVSLAEATTKWLERS